MIQLPGLITPCQSHTAQDLRCCATCNPVNAWGALPVLDSLHAMPVSLTAA